MDYHHYSYLALIRSLFQRLQFSELVIIAFFRESLCESCELIRVCVVCFVRRRRTKHTTQFPLFIAGI